jgi:hypothetical protein
MDNFWQSANNTQCGQRQYGIGHGVYPTRFQLEHPTTHFLATERYAELHRLVNAFQWYTGFIATTKLQWGIQSAKCDEYTTADVRLKYPVCSDAEARRLRISFVYTANTR